MVKLVKKEVVSEAGLKPSFIDVKRWYERNLHPDVIDLNDQRVYNDVYCAGRWAGVFQFTAKGAQQFCVRAQPKNIIDIAAITSIYRPGPLVAGVDRDYVAAKNEPDKVVYEHPLIKDVLGSTFGFLVFQEQMLKLGHVVGKMPLAKCDRLRKVITKRSVESKDKAAVESEALGKEFIVGAIQNGFTEKKAEQLWDSMAAFKGYAFNLSHALSYAIDSYMCAWLLTYFEPEWLCAYMETQDNQPDSRAKAISELRSFGYEIVKVDINHASDGWTILPGKKFMPSLSTVKSVGAAAIEEIQLNRPYRTVDDLLYRPDGSWKHSKFNKRALENLIKIGAFDSMDIVGEGKTFRSYHHMWRCIIDDNAKVKHHKTGRSELQRRIKELWDTSPEWPKDVLIKQSKELVGSSDLSLIISPDARRWIELKLGVKSIDELEQKGLCWFIADELQQKTTKNGKPYMMITAIGMAGKRYRIYCWGYSPDKHKLHVNTPYIAELEPTQFGFSTQAYRMRRAEERRS